MGAQRIAIDGKGLSIADYLQSSLRDIPQIAAKHEVGGEDAPERHLCVLFSLQFYT